MHRLLTCRSRAVEVNDVVALEFVEHCDLLGDLRHRRLARGDLLQSLDRDDVPAERHFVDNPEGPLGNLPLNVDLCGVRLRRDDRLGLESELESRLRVALHATLSAPAARRRHSGRRRDEHPERTRPRSAAERHGTSRRARGTS